MLILLVNVEIVVIIVNGGIMMRFYLVGSFKGLDLVNILIIVGY